MILTRIRGYLAKASCLESDASRWHSFATKSRSVVLVVPTVLEQKCFQEFLNNEFLEDILTYTFSCFDG